MKHKYITQFKYEHANGYQVRLPEMKDGKFIRYNGENRFFKRSAYKTWKSCLDDALSYRNKRLKQLKAGWTLTETKSGRTDIGMKNTGRNTSGAIGVVHDVMSKDSGVYEGYVANFQINKKQVSRYFSISRYRECEAFRLACEARFEHKGTIIIKDLDAIPCFPNVKYEVLNDT